MSHGPFVLMVKQNVFQHGWLGATRRLFHLAEAFSDLGIKTVILTGRAIRPEIQLEMDEQFPGVIIRTEHTGDYPNVLDGSAFLRRVWRAVWRLSGGSRYATNVSWGWAKRLNVEDMLGKLTAHRINPMLVWGICSGDLAGPLAAQRIAANLGVPYVLELHDPPNGAGVGTDVDDIIRAFRKNLTASARVVVTARSYGERLQSVYGLPPERWEAIHLTYDPQFIQNGLVGAQHQNILPDQFSLVYAGSLDSKRSLIPLARALVILFERQPEMRKTFHLKLAGRGPGFQELARFVEANHLQPNIEMLGVLSGETMAKLLGNASAFVITQPEEYRYQVPGKIFESLAFRKPILGIMASDMEASDILRNSGLGRVHDPKDINGIATTLRHFWEEHQVGRVAVNANEVFIEQFSLRSLRIKLSALLEGLVARPPMPPMK